MLVQVNVVQYNVTWLHVKYLACSPERVHNIQNYESVLGPSKKLIIKEKLLSYSLYEVFIEASTLNDYYKVNSYKAGMSMESNS